MVCVCVGLFMPAMAEDFVSTRAPNAIIMDYETGDILFAKEATTPVAPASMSKLMTAAVVLDLIDRGEIRPDTMFDVSEEAWLTGGSEMFVLVDTQISVLNLLKGLIVQSGNDAAIVLAENISGTEDAFATLMNQRARAWGLDQSRFNNPRGIDHPDQKMSVRDLAKLARLIWQRFPDYRYIFGMTEFTWSDITQRNRNPLIGTFAGADGMKTGQTEEAGWCIVGTAERDGQRRIIVLAGLTSADERRQEADRMMRLAFDDFLSKTYFTPGDEIGEAEVFGGLTNSVPLRIDVPVEYVKHKRALAAAEAKIMYRGPLVAPIREGEQVAVLEVSIPGETKREYPLYASKRVRSLGPISKMRAGVRELFTPPTEGSE